MQPSEPSSDLPHLRRRAEQHPPPTPPRPLPTTNAELQRLVQELQVHQVELELQHEELLTAQLQAELSQAQYADLYNSAPVGYCTLDRHGVLRQCNALTRQLLGEPSRHLLGRPLALFIEPEGLVRLSDLLGRLWAVPGRRHASELWLHRPGSQPLRVLVEGVATLGNPERAQEAGYHLVLLDITKRHVAAETLAANEVRFRATFDQSHDGMLLLEDHHFVDANSAALRLLGLGSLEQLLRRPLTEFWPPTQPDGRPTQQAIDRCVREAEQRGWCRLELLRYNPAGEAVWDELSFNPVVMQGQALLHVGWRNVTARRHAEEQLRQSEARLHQALEAASTGVWSLELATDTVQPDGRAQEIFGVGPGIPFALLKASMHPDDVASVEQALATAAAETSSFDLEHRLLRPDGSVRHVAATGSFDYDAATGEPRYLRGLVRDVTARHQAEEELSYKNRLLHNLLRNVPVLLARIGPDGRFREYTGTPLRRLSLADNEVVGRLATEVFPESAAYFRRVLAGEPVNYTMVLTRHEQTVHLQVHGFFDTDSQEAILFGSDITETEYLKEEATRQRLRQQQALVAAVLEAQETERSRIAESLHNGLGQLLYATKLQLDRAYEPGAPAPHAEAGRLLSEAIRQARTISHELSPALLEAHGLAAALRAVCQHMSSAHLHWQCHLALDDTPPLPQPLQIAVYRLAQELVQNVVKHAQARHATLEADVLPGWVVLRVEDDGAGFDPAVTTGGLGLRTLRSRVALLGGTVHLDSAPGQGTQVQLRLPLAPG